MCVYSWATLCFLHTDLLRLTSSHVDVTDHLLFGYPTFPTYWGNNSSKVEQRDGQCRASRKPMIHLHNTEAAVYFYI